MKHLIIGLACGLFAVFTLPHILPWTTTHAFALGDLNIKVFHIAALLLIGLVFYKGGR